MILLQCDGMSSWVNGCDVCIPGKIGSLVSTVYNAILIAVPLLLIISGMFSLASAIMKQKEEDVKKAQQLLVKKLIAGAIVFLLFALVRWLVSYFDNGLTNCFDALINYKSGTAHECTDSTCSASGNMSFITENNSCKQAGADGAVIINNNTVCYIKDYENCCCDGGQCTPFKYYDKSNKTATGGCMCAIQSVVNGQHVVSGNSGKTTGTCN